VKVNVHCCPVVLGATVAVYVPLQLTDSGLLPVQNAGADEREHDDAFDDEKLRTTDPPVEGTMLGLIARVAVGEVAGGVVGGGVVVGGGWLTAAACLTVTLP
jgi:hypothetical protein